MDVRNIGQALRSIKDSLETTKNQEEAEKLQRKVQQQEQGLLKACKRKDDLERQFSLIESNIARARKYTQYVIETAMNEANLAPRAEMPPGGNKSDTSGSDGDDQDRTAHDVVRHVKGPSFCEQSSVIPVDSHALASHSEIIRRVAYEDFIQKSEMLHRFRATFDNQQLQYGDDLADYQQGAAKGTCKFSRSGFDRRDVDPARKLTGGLVALEQACDKAEGHARAPGATKSTSWSSHYSEDEESRAGSRVISHNASYDWSRVHEWLEHVPQCEIPEDPGNVEIDDWDWREVDPEDSISQKACALLDDPQPEEFYLGQIDERPLERRRSF